MIIGTGIDMVDADRIEDRIRSDGFREMVFSLSEIEYCEKQTHKAQHYAARFAAKEAFLKAAGTGLWTGFDIRQIELVKDALGKPSLRLQGQYEQMAKEKHWQKIHVSLSHVQSMACAIVIIEG